MVDDVVSVQADARDILRVALDVSEDGFAVHRIRRDVDGAVEGFTLVLINRVGAEPLGGDPAALVGADVADVLGPGGGPLLDAFRRCAQTGIRQQVRTTFSESSLAGTTESIVVRIDGDHLLSTWRDVTDQAVEQFILQESLRMRSDAWRDLEAVLDAVGDAVVALRLPASGRSLEPAVAARSRVMFANETAATSLGLSAAVVARSTLAELVGDAWALRLGRLLCDAAAAGEASERIVVRDASGRVQDARHVTVRAMAEGRVVLVSRDVTNDEWARPVHD